MHRRGSVFPSGRDRARACAGPSAAPSSLIGTWKPESAEFDGDVFPTAGFRGAALVLTADTHAFGDDRRTRALVASDRPSAMDVRGLEGPNAGRTILAIHRRDGDAPTICDRLGAGERPTTFATMKRSQLLLVRYRRAA